MTPNRPSKVRSKNPVRRRSKQKYLIIEIALISAVVIGLIFLFSSINSRPPSADDPSNTASNNTPNSNSNMIYPQSSNGTSKENNTVPEEEFKEMTLLCTGDIMYHSSQIDSAYNAQSGTYDFSPSYAYVKNLITSADYAVANFETTLAGDALPYQGFPAFNSPDTAFTALVSAGFDMMLFANNHCYDTGRQGLLRTQEIFNKYKIDYIGARMSKLDKTYQCIEVNGIKIGMLNSTDDLSYGNLEKRTLNGITLADNDLPLIDLFNHSLMDQFFESAEKSINDLRDNGADIIVYFIHWGNEYELRHNSMQEQIAQKLCNLGVDVIIGGHPHVIQDAKILTSESDPSQKTLCYYSLGNFISNQNRLTLGNVTANKEHTENGLAVKLTIRKYNDGTCLVTDVTSIPLWVHRYISQDGSGKMKYDVIPLESALENPSAFGLDQSSFGVAHATDALKMTNATLGGIDDAFAYEIKPFIPS